ncbi:MAG: sulfurtransferase [Candidatus Taylorbacteria bacterium CG11_big_fil_rev_8_21_14_0_20_46_11]|uniref:Sulfurtransferase n=1 Tax=Candidatus Taylorbacteria bacterium CG11_big_fil_rev_8_21_14_0_20_46_11 TaxID=1975025 RepID=A0A2H0KD92_9BACT|nr:MAG: sulfurtransferase [Candidatus Taylorbacteria bacterium CG11_big_fil_rev_8_21_14_0_20_46_11]
MKTQKVTFISKEALFEMIENKEPFKLVEVLAKEDYAGGHLPGAISIPVSELETASPSVLPDKNERIVVYCASFLCSASTGAARTLQSHGYTNVLDYKGGKQDWNTAGLPLMRT